jgi:hypothetical protein
MPFESHKQNTKVGLRSHAYWSAKKLCAARTRA